MTTALGSALSAALYSKLAASAGTALWGGRIYDQFAPAGVAGSGQPYILYEVISGGERPLTPTRHADARYTVKCVANSAAQARTGAGHIETALRATSLTISGWQHIATTQEGLVDSVESREGRQWWSMGAVYRVRADEG